MSTSSSEEGGADLYMDNEEEQLIKPETRNINRNFARKVRVLM